MNTMPIIDAHLHVWHRATNSYPWLTPALGPLDADFSAEDARAELDAAGVDAAVLVQASDTVEETRRMLELARDRAWIAGVVGWIPLDDPGSAVAALDALETDPRLCGIRHLVHDDPRDDFLRLPAVRESLAEVARRGLAFDVPDAWPRHLGASTDLAAELPQLVVVIDHLAKPPVSRPDFADWLAELRRAAELPNTVAKFSGLDVDSVRPLWELALELFGPRRLMYGSDWPMTVRYGGYSRTWEAVSALFDELGPLDRAAVLGGTASQVYGLSYPTSDSGLPRRQGQRLPVPHQTSDDLY
jgi:L-fuconolactonase